MCMLVAVVCSCADKVVTKEQASKSALIELKVRFELGAKKGKIAKSVGELEARDGYLNATVDGWGKEIRMSSKDGPDSSLRIEFRSAGPDRVFDNSDDLVEVVEWPSRNP